MTKKLTSITDPSVVYTFGLNKRTFEQIWHYVFCQNKTPYAYDERDRLWDLMCCEHQDEKSRGI